MLLMSMKSQVLRVIFRTPGRVDVEPSSVADSLRECAEASPRAWQSVVDVDVVDDVKDKVIEVFFFKLCAQSGDTTDSWFSSDTHARTSIMVDLLFISIVFT
jgi:hypothetical protein